jgi:hypothetical protein
MVQLGSGGTVIVSYHDDHYVIADPLEALQMFDQLTRELESIGLAVNPNKSQIYSKGQVTIDANARDLFEGRGFEIVPPSKGIIVAGAPVGSPHFISNFHFQLIDKIRSEIERVADICRVPSIVEGNKLFSHPQVRTDTSQLFQPRLSTRVQPWSGEGNGQNAD